MMDKGPFSRMDRLIKEKRHDVYREDSKLPEPTLCNKCGALFVNGHWTWKEPPDTTHKTLCPACRRIEDKYPAGIVEIKGRFIHKHRSEILNMIGNVEKMEKGERPLERIISINIQKKQTLITTTGIHVARRIGEALSRSYQGDLSFTYADGDQSIRVYWER